MSLEEQIKEMPKIPMPKPPPKDDCGSCSSGKSKPSGCCEGNKKDKCK